MAYHDVRHWGIVTSFLTNSAAEVGRVELGAYRSASIVETCAVCGERSAGHHCHRCATPLCGLHRTDVNGRCAGCETTYATLVNDRRAHPLPGGALLFSYLLAAAAVALSILVVDGLTLSRWLLLPLALLAGFTPLFFYRYRLRRLRPRFLGETPRRRVLRTCAPRARKKGPAAPPLVIAGFSLSLFFMIPLGPILAAVLIAVGMARQPSGHRLSALSVAGLTAALFAFLLQLAMICC